MRYDNWEYKNRGRNKNVYCALQSLVLTFKSVELTPVCDHSNERIKYLGIYIDQNLQWGPQTQHINNKLAIINKLRYFVDLHTLKQLYYSFIYPYLSYATIAWGSACKTSLRRILTKQNKCVRSMFFAHSKFRITWG